MARIHHWTRGHPYLTQKLCKAVVEAQAAQWAETQTDQLVSRLFLRQEASKEDNLAFVRNFVLNQDNKSDLLNTYRQVWQGKEVVDNERSPVINQLKLAGLVKTEAGHLHNRNEIYRQVFDEVWVRENTAVDWTRVVAVTLGIMLMLIFVYMGHNYWQEQQVKTAAAPLHSLELRRMTPGKVCEHLYQVLHPRGLPLRSFDSQGLAAFKEAIYTDAQKTASIFTTDDCALEKKMLFIETFYDTLAYTDWESNEDSTWFILQKMAEVDTPYRQELEAWVEARQLWREGDLESALSAYNRAIAQNSNNENENGATHWERARLLLSLGESEAAAQDLQKVMEIALLLADEESDEETATPTATATAVADTENLSPAPTADLATAPTTDLLVGTVQPQIAAGEWPANVTPTPTPVSEPVWGEITVRFSDSSEMELAVSQLIESSSDLRIEILAGGYPDLRPLLFGAVRVTDGMQMVAVPAGTFTMGSSPAKIESAVALCNQTFGEGTCTSDSFADETPAHTVQLDAFQIDQTEVTNAQFAAFLNEQGNQEEGGTVWLDLDSSFVLIEEGGNAFQPLADFENHPVVKVTWYGANAYCQWAGGQLPTEAQWEYVARGSAGNVFPWGDEFDGTRLNYCDSNCEFDGDETVDDGYARTAPVGSYAAGDSWIGAQDMAGNVWEWTADWYDANYYNSFNETVLNITGPTTGDFKVLRGGGWVSFPDGVRGATRGSVTPVFSDVRVGFRCVVGPGN